MLWLSLYIIHRVTRLTHLFMRDAYTIIRQRMLYTRAYFALWYCVRWKALSAGTCNVYLLEWIKKQLFYIFLTSVCDLVQSYKYIHTKHTASKPALCNVIVRLQETWLLRNYCSFSLTHIICVHFSNMGPFFLIWAADLNPSKNSHSLSNSCLFVKLGGGRFKLINPLVIHTHSIWRTQTDPHMHTGVLSIWCICAIYFPYTVYLNVKTLIHMLSCSLILYRHIYTFAGTT